MPTSCVLAFDVGNTSVKCAMFVRGHWQLMASVPTTPEKGLGKRIAQSMPASKVRALRPARCVVSSVCPPAHKGIQAYWRRISAGGRAEFFGVEVPVPIPARVSRPAQVGTDRLLLALGARALHGAPCIVVGAGTAITVDLVDTGGAFAGGAIAPGFRLAAEALHKGTALLPLVEPDRPQSPAGRDTTSAIRSGVYWSCAGGVLALIERLRQEPGCAQARIVCTGADAPLLLPVVAPRSSFHEPKLVFHGMSTALGLTAHTTAGRAKGKHVR